MRKLRIFINTLKSGFKGVWTNRSMGFASIISIFAVLTILGFIMIATFSINRMVGDVEKKVDEIDVFLLDSITKEQKESIENVLKSQQGLETYSFKTKEQSYEDFKKILKDDAYILEGFENALPTSYVIKMKDLGKSKELVEKLKPLEGIDKIRYNQDLISKMMTISKYVYYGGLSMIILLIFISLFVISNTIKLTVFARRKEIGIMKYVGATNTMISGPFIIEGLVFGFLGSLVSFLVVYLGYSYIYSRYNNNMFNVFSTYLGRPEIIFKDILVIFFTLGVGIGALGSLFSLRKHLDV